MPSPGWSTRSPLQSLELGVGEEPAGGTSSVVDLDRLDGQQPVDVGGQAVPARGFQPSVPGELRDEHEVRALADHARQKRVAQDVGGEPHARILAEASDEIVHGPLRQPAAATPEKERPLLVRRQARPLAEPLLERLTGRNAASKQT
jgi:hypothetical protein